jgi:hypothetical protein
VADAAMELTLVPPEIFPTLNVVLVLLDPENVKPFQPIFQGHESDLGKPKIQ